MKSLNIFLYEGKIKKLLNFPYSNCKISFDTFTVNHKNAKIKATAKIETSKGETKYEVEFMKGKKKVEEMYKEDGTIIK